MRALGVVEMYPSQFNEHWAMYAAWRGGPPTIDAMMKQRGLKPAANAP